MSEGPSQKISKGKLPDRYRNRRKSLKSAGVVVSRSSNQLRHDRQPTSNFVLSLQFNFKFIRYDKRNFFPFDLVFNVINKD